jgi:hypothetical protein
MGKKIKASLPQEKEHEATLEVFREYFLDFLARENFRVRVARDDLNNLLDTLNFEKDKKKRDLLFKQLEEAHWFCIQIKKLFSLMILGDEQDQHSFRVFASAMIQRNEHIKQVHNKAKELLLQEGADLKKIEETFKKA